MLSVQEKYLANDNVSEILRGRLKILGKVSAVHKDELEKAEGGKTDVIYILPKMFNLPES